MRRIGMAATRWLITLPFLVLIGCGGGGDGGSAPPLNYTVGGTVSGLNGTLVLQNNGGNDLSLSTNGSFQFTSAIASGAAYNVTVKTQPANQQCSVASGSGTVTSANVSTVLVSCVTPTYSVGGTLTGLGANATLVLQNNGGDDLTLSADGPFQFATPLARGSTYAVTVKTLPAGQHCFVTQGSGAIAAQDITTVSVHCPLQQVLFDFDPRVTDLRFPVAGLLLASDGNFYGVTSAMSAVIKVTPAGVFSEVYRFGLTDVYDATYPQSGLIEASDGNFYGTANSGGANNMGAVYKLTPGGTESVLYSFGSGSTDAARPVSSLIQASDGNFYGTTPSGGANGSGTVFKLTPAGVESILWSFDAGTQSFAGLLQASDGNLYGTTASGGTYGAGTVFRLTLTGTYTLLWSFGGAGDGTGPQHGLMQASDGNLYGTTMGGGTYNFGTVFRITPSGTESVLWNFGGTHDGIWPSGVLLQGKDGYLYGTTASGGAYGPGTIYRIALSGAEDVVWDFSPNPVPGSGGAVPLGLVQDASGDLYGTTQTGGNFVQGTVFRLRL